MSLSNKQIASLELELIEVERTISLLNLDFDIYGELTQEQSIQYQAAIQRRDKIYELLDK